MDCNKWIEILTKGDENEKKKIYDLTKDNFDSIPMAIMEYRRNKLNTERNINLVEIFNNNIDETKEVLQELFLEYYEDNEWSLIKQAIKKENIILPDILVLHINSPTDRLLSTLKLI